MLQLPGNRACLCTCHIYIYIYVACIFLFIFIWSNVASSNTLCYTVKLRPSFKRWCRKLKHDVFALPKKLFCIFQKGRMKMSCQEFVTFGGGNLSELVFFSSPHPPPVDFPGWTFSYCGSNHGKMSDWSKHVLPYILVKWFSFYFGWV